MKYYELDTDEKKLLESFEKDELESALTQASERKRYREYARHSLNRTKNINIRLSERDLQKIKQKAAEKGIPYQTMVASILHQYGTH